MKALAFSSALIVLLVGCEAGVNRQKRDNHASGSATEDGPRPVLINNIGKHCLHHIACRNIFCVNPVTILKHFFPQPVTTLSSSLSSVIFLR